MAARPLITLLDFTIYSNFFIAACVAAFTFQATLFFPEHSEIITAFTVLNFISTFVLYNLQRLYYASKENVNEKYSWYAQHRRLVFTLIVLLLMCFFTRIFSFFAEHPGFLITYGILVVLSIFYFLPPLQLRKYGALKPFLIAMVFTCVGILIPLHKVDFKPLFLYASGQFCFIAALCILFDIKDLLHDTELQLNTLPQKLGIPFTKAVVVFILMVYLCTGFLVSAAFFTGYLITFALGCLLTFLAQPGRPVYFYLLFVDGLILLQYLVLDFLGYGV